MWLCTRHLPDSHLIVRMKLQLQSSQTVEVKEEFRFDSVRILITLVTGVSKVVINS